MLDRLPQQPGPCTSISRRRAKRCVGMSPVAAYARHEKRKNRVPSHDRGSPSIVLRSGVAPCRASRFAFLSWTPKMRQLAKVEACP